MTDLDVRIKEEQQVSAVSNQQQKDPNQVSTEGRKNPNKKWIKRGDSQPQQKETNEIPKQRNAPK